MSNIDLNWMRHAAGLLTESEARQFNETGAATSAFAKPTVDLSSASIQAAIKSLTQIVAEMKDENVASLATPMIEYLEQKQTAIREAAKSTAPVTECLMVTTMTNETYGKYRSWAEIRNMDHRVLETARAYMAHASKGGAKLLTDAVVPHEYRRYVRIAEGKTREDLLTAYPQARWDSIRNSWFIRK